MNEDDKLYMNGQEVKLKNPGTAGLKDFLIVSKAVNKAPKINPVGKTPEQIEKEYDELNINILDYLDEKAMDSAVNLINLSVKKTFKEVTDEIDGWAMSNFMKILVTIINMSMPSEQSYEKEKIDKLKESIQQK